MGASDVFLMMTLIAMLGILIFTGSAIVNVFKREHSKDDLIKALIFLGLSILFFILFGVFL